MSEFLPLFCFTLFTLFAPYTCLSPNGEAKVRGIFVFGSSVVDNGNNNFLTNTRARADYSPYGVDFSIGPTGRFTDGKNWVDFLAEKLKLPNYIPPFNDPLTSGCRVLHGVNYASGGSGILDSTGPIAGNVTSLNEQIREFERKTLPDLKHGSELGEYLFVVASGGNDYLFNYFLQTPPVPTLQAFTANLTSTLSHQLTRLYSLGARKFIVMAINPNGCSPMARSRAPTSMSCVESLNRAVELFNNRLRELVDDIQTQMPGSNLVFLNSYHIIKDILTFPRLRGFVNTNTSCCEVGGTGVLCRRGGSVCPNRNDYVYFDGLHTTEAVNYIVATKAFVSTLGDEVYPFNVQRLSEI